MPIHSRRVSSTSVSMGPIRAWSRTARRLRSVVTTTALLMVFAGCSDRSDATPTNAPADGSTSASTSTTATDPDSPGDNAESGGFDLFDSNVVHTIDVEFEQGEYDAMIEAFTSTGNKEWVSATVVVDASVYDNVGMRLKGNSSLFGLTSATSGNPEDLPWLIRFDKFVDGEDHQGYEEIVVRSNSTETALNEAVAQELLASTGLASQKPMAAAFTVNGGETELRLIVEHPDEEWYEENFDDASGLLYKADSDGDYSYRGDRPDAYVDVFDQKVGDDDMEPLIDFLDFINNVDDSTFAAGLDERLDTDAFATYLAFQDVIGNADDINGRGNNSYLQYDTTTKQFTVVSWDLNLAFATANVGGGRGPGGEADTGRPARGGAGRPQGPPPGAAGEAGGGAGGPGDQANVLVDRFMAVEGFAATYATQHEELTERLFTSGTVDDVIAKWTRVLANDAPDLVSEATVTADADALTDYVDELR